MRKEPYLERPFEFLKRRNGEPFSDETVRNWYRARAIVLDRLKPFAIAPDSGQHLHIVVNGDSPLMLSVVRQAALSAHFLNYEEFDRLGRLSCKNRTVITVVSHRDEAEITGLLEKEEYLCNLLKHCRHSVFGQVRNGGSWIDIEIQIVKEAARESDNPLWIDESEITHFLQSLPQDEVFAIDTRKAVYTDRVYQLSGQIANLPAEDIHCAKRYSHALDTFQYRLLQDEVSPLVDETCWKCDPPVVKNGLSNIYCSDCFETRLSGIKDFAERHSIPEKEAWEINNEALSLSEHQRWSVEKLILGYRPLDDDERLAVERLFGKQRAHYISRLKKDSQSPALIDLCSNRDLRRIDPDSMKYDSFLLLAIPSILKKVSQE